MDVIVPIAFTCICLARLVEPFGDNAGERAAPRWRRRRPGIPEPGVVIPQPVPAEGVPDPHEDHAGSGGLSDGPGESHPGGELRGSGSHHITQSPALMSLLGRFLCEYNNYTMLVCIHHDASLRQSKRKTLKKK